MGNCHKKEILNKNHLYSGMFEGSQSTQDAVLYEPCSDLTALMFKLRR
jgi:hypothetical protein